MIYWVPCMMSIVLYGFGYLLKQLSPQRASIRSFSLISDSNYIVQNASRLLRGLFEISLRKDLATVATKLLDLCHSVDKRLWSHFNTPLRQLDNFLSDELYRKIESRHLDLYDLIDMPEDEIGQWLRHVRMGPKV